MAARSTRPTPKRSRWAWGCSVVSACFGSVTARRRCGRFLGRGLYNLFWYFGRSDAFDRIWLPMLGGGKQDLPMLAWAYFTINNGVVMVGPALLAAWLLYRMTPADLGLWGGGNAHPPVRRIWIVYAVAFAVALPFIVHAGTTQAFVNRYPLYRWAIGPDLMLTVGELLVYEGLYVLSFVFLEAFFRGFLLFSLERGLGLYCLAVMSVPYVCGHFGKPEPEALGAILAGTALGWFALKHRSIWPGVLLHVGMAIIMDTMALLGRGVLVTW